MDVHSESVDLSVLVAAVIKEAEAMGRDRPYRVQLVCPRDLRIDTDPAKLQQILTNLVANAIKFTSQGSVTVEVKADEPDYVTISVIDTGIGIRPEHLEIIFEEFRQVDGSSTRRFGGTGLGLAIAQRLAEMLGNKLEVKSTYGMGSTFSLRIPREYLRNCSRRAAAAACSWAERGGSGGAGGGGPGSGTPMWPVVAAFGAFGETID